MNATANAAFAGSAPTSWRQPLVSALAVIAALWISLPALPIRVAVHFDLAGRPDRWTHRVQAAAEFSGGVVVCVGVFALAAVLVRRLPARWVNIPNAEQWLAPPHRSATLSAIDEWLARQASAVTALFGWLWFTVLVAHQQAPVTLPAKLLFAGVASWLVALGVAIATLYRRFSPPAASP
ncbi:MAG: DUF1648 domain-containing protein [Kiritimatiellae bacterium]|nr:DUF1648 domain-containing protein [Kiritimatiellia bacterium]